MTDTNKSQKIARLRRELSLAQQMRDNEMVLWLLEELHYLSR